MESKNNFVSLYFSILQGCEIPSTISEGKFCVQYSHTLNISLQDCEITATFLKVSLLNPIIHTFTRVALLWRKWDPA